MICVFMRIHLMRVVCRESRTFLTEIVFFLRSEALVTKGTSFLDSFQILYRSAVTAVYGLIHTYYRTTVTA